MMSWLIDKKGESPIGDDNDDNGHYPYGNDVNDAKANDDDDYTANDADEDLLQEGV